MKIKLLLPLFLLLGVSLTAQLPQATAMIPISVSVTGFVPHPGTYQLTVFSRLSDAVKASRGELPQISDPLTMSPLQQKAVQEDSLYANFQGLRQLRLTRQGKSQVYDLLRFMRLGELEQNPLLKDGDLIWVPTLEQSVSVMGSVYLPGEYQFGLATSWATCSGSARASLPRPISNASSSIVISPTEWILTS
jgi:protein involved in polysaccharide export with SLBB domain